MKIPTSSLDKKRLVVSFDAFGTLFTPRTPVFQQYYEIAAKHKVPSSIESVALEFPKVYKELNEKYPNYGKDFPNIIKTPDDWWRELIIKVFRLNHYKKDEFSASLCNKLLDHFTTTDAYEAYEDVLPILEYLKERNIRIIISTNSDPRIEESLENLGILKYVDKVYTSYSIGTSKPNILFFNEILSLERKLVNEKKNTAEANDPLILHVGDERVKDQIAAQEAGWIGIYVNREKSITENDEQLKINSGFAQGNTIDTLYDLMKIIK